MRGYGHIGAGAACALGLLLSAAPVAMAQEAGGLSVAQPAPCEFASDLGRFLTTSEIEAPQAVRPVQQIVPDVLRGGLAYFEVRDLHGQGDGSQWIVLQHCPTSQDLLVRLNANDEAVRTQMWDLLAAPEPYTMSEVAAILTDLGATAETGDVDLGDCACEHQRFYFGD